ncbi:MAG: ribonuclease P protein component [Coriobacteriia bacterium]|nr:ribonuclease P protein component [Coriobacteriia bacterium]
MNIIKSSREIEMVFRAARRGAHPILVALVINTPKGRGPQGRVAFVAGKKLGGAVQRNRAKRVVREATRRVGGPWAGFDVVLISREKTGDSSPRALDSALKVVLGKTGVIT